MSRASSTTPNFQIKKLLFWRPGLLVALLWYQRLGRVVAKGVVRYIPYVTGHVTAVGAGPVPFCRAPISFRCMFEVYDSIAITCGA